MFDFYSRKVPDRTLVYRLFLVVAPRQKLERKVGRLVDTCEYDSDVRLSPVAVVPCLRWLPGERVRSNGSSSRREARGSLSAAISHSLWWSRLKSRYSQSSSSNSPTSSNKSSQVGVSGLLAVPNICNISSLSSASGARSAQGF